MYETASGQVRGRAPAGDVVAVLGIPYAEPPFGAGRFRAPRPRTPWSGVRDCTEFGPIPPQSAELPGAPSWSPGDEDVLSLNVWTPAGATGPLPVLVWIHGGAYTFGSSAQPDFDGTALARAGLVVVTLNYRVGFEGFGHVPAGGPDDACPPNRGLLDQIAALEWVRDNIAAFGGAPDNVTVAGQSAGATSAVCLMVMEGARGLFRRVIAHSAVGPVFARELAERVTERVAAAAGTPATRAALAGASPQTLLRASAAVVDEYRKDPGSGQLHWDPVIYGPVADGRLLRDDPLHLIAAGAARDAGLLVCHTTEEYWLMDAVGSSTDIPTDERLHRFAADFGLPAGLIEGYRALMPGAGAYDIHLAVYGDLMFGEYCSRLAEAHTAAGGRSFLSRFDRRGGGARPWHCADVPFAFGNVDDESIRFLIGGAAPTAGDRALADRMTAAWAGFAATGHPGWEPDGGEIRVWGAPDDAVASGPWRDSGAVRALWGAYSYRPARS
ncbi:carboxylesterase/lipase family protein [Streptomyces sp. NBC_01789]|uniref:carboxylesterase/lipase family protein n=1 Tax=Streptomyces sp. NBC_01789 TaxID=2975941 RepID=UPI002254230B|nr:carboxylesterase family protein [Streptomyces sp. NBC_01789]MCX4445191.1 carboxylesterase family protein [Streptomyces sp. NBC_01789]